MPLQRLPDLLLSRVIGTHREGHELVERHLLLGIGVEQRRRDGGELQPLLDHAGRDEEGCRDLLLSAALLAHRLEGAELVERMQWRALDVLGETVLLGEPVGAHNAGHQRGLVHALLLDEQFQRPEPPPAGRDRVHAGLGTALVQHGPHGDGAEQRPPRDVLGQFIDRDPCLDVAHVRLAEHQLVEGDVARGAEGDLLLLGHRGISVYGVTTGALKTQTTPHRGRRYGGTGSLSPDLQTRHGKPGPPSHSEGAPDARTLAQMTARIAGHSVISS